MVRLALALALWLLGPAAAFAEGAATGERAGEGDAADAVKIAGAAFEYRDFHRVVDLLTPWVHPPRIPERRLMVEARRLLGVSQHVLGNVPAAREEFAQLLLQDPLHQLDAFTVPPKVIETFESVRKAMKPTLDRVLAERGQRIEIDDKPRTFVPVPVEVPNRLIMFFPGGAPQFAVDEPRLGAVLGGLQVLGLAANVTGFFAAEGSERPTAGFERWRAVQYTGAGLALGAYALSVILGNLALDGYTHEVVERARTTEPPRVRGLEGPAR